MRIPFQLKKSDIMWLNIDVSLRRKQPYLMAATFSVIFFGWKYLSEPFTDQMITLIVHALIIGICALVGHIAFNCIYHVWASMKSPGVLGQLEVEVSPEGVFIVSQISEGIQKWAGVLELIEGHQRLYIQCHKLMFLIVPSRAFENLSKFNEFKALCQEYWVQAHN